MSTDLVDITPWRRRRCSLWGGSTSTCCASAPVAVPAADSRASTALPHRFAAALRPVRAPRVPL